MLHTFSLDALRAELIELSREIAAADPGDLPGLQALFCRVETELNSRTGGAL